MIPGFDRRSGVYVVFCTQLDAQKQKLLMQPQQKQICVAILTSPGRDDADEPVHTFSLYVPVTAMRVT